MQDKETSDEFTFGQARRGSAREINPQNAAKQVKRSTTYSHVSSLKIGRTIYSLTFSLTVVRLVTKEEGEACAEGSTRKRGSQSFPIHMALEKSETESEGEPNLVTPASDKSGPVIGVSITVSAAKQDAQGGL